MGLARWLAVSLLIISLSCGRDPPCAQTCSGCCYNGYCFLGTAKDRCGKGGETCTSCSGSLICGNATCVPPSGGNGGGGGGGTGGGGGGAAGGAGGGDPCSACGPGFVCQSQQCVQQVAITLQWNWAQDYFCPKDDVLKECTAGQLMTKPDVARLAIVYAGCPVTETASTARFDCRGNCTAQQSYCASSSTYKSSLQCVMPKGTYPGACTWTPPP